LSEDAKRRAGRGRRKRNPGEEAHQELPVFRSLSGPAIVFGSEAVDLEELPDEMDPQERATVQRHRFSLQSARLPQVPPPTAAAAAAAVAAAMP
jgi:hypothetical protein